MEVDSCARKRSAIGEIEKKSLLNSPEGRVSHGTSVAATSVGDETPVVVGSWRLLIASILFFLSSLVVFSMSVNSPKFATASSPCYESPAVASSTPTSSSPQQHKSPYTYPDVIYGHAHIAKTAGTSLNGNLSMHYERICGHKGYSFDAIDTNERFKQSGQSRLTYAGDSYSKLRPNFNRGKVPHSLMKEIGFQDCDWISHETTWEWWFDVANETSIPLELHVPCRSPVDHLMSQCNFKVRRFDCNKTGAAMIAQIKQCILFIDTRYNKVLNDTFDTKCFDFGKTNDYMEWIGQRLQQRRIETEYAYRNSNIKRRKDQECVWNRPDVQDVIERYLIDTYDYYKFCDSCLGSKQDLFASQKGRR